MLNVFDGPRRKGNDRLVLGNEATVRTRRNQSCQSWAIEDRMRCALRDVPRRRITLVVNGNERNNPSCERICRYRPTKAGIIRIGMFRIADDLLLDDLSLNLSIDELRSLSFGNRVKPLHQARRLSVALGNCPPIPD